MEEKLVERDLSRIWMSGRRGSMTLTKDEILELIADIEKRELKFADTMIGKYEMPSYNEHQAIIEGLKLLVQSLKPA